MAHDLTHELSVDELGRGYSTMSDQEAVDDMHIAYRTRNRTSMSSSEILNAVDASEYTSLSNTKKVEFWNLMSIGTLNPFGVEATLLVNIFGDDSNTITALKALRKESITRVTELGLGEVKSRNIGYARN